MSLAVDSVWTPRTFELRWPGRLDDDTLPVILETRRYSTEEIAALIADHLAAALDRPVKVRLVALAKPGGICATLASEPAPRRIKPVRGPIGAQAKPEPRTRTRICSCPCGRAEFFYGRSERCWSCRYGRRSTCPA